MAEVEETVVSTMLTWVCVAVSMVVEKSRLRHVDVSVTHVVSVKQHTHASQGHSLPQMPPLQLLLQRGLFGGGTGPIPRHLGQAESQHLSGGGGPQQVGQGQAASSAACTNSPIRFWYRICTRLSALVSLSNEAERLLSLFGSRLLGLSLLWLSVLSSMLLLLDSKVLSLVKFDSDISNVSESVLDMLSGFFFALKLSSIESAFCSSNVNAMELLSSLDLSSLLKSLLETNTTCSPPLENSAATCSLGFWAAVVALTLRHRKIMEKSGSRCIARLKVSMATQVYKMINFYFITPPEWQRPSSSWSSSRTWEW